MPAGRLKSWNRERGWGFLDTPGYGDVFVHCTELHRASFTPHVNDWFNFELKQDRNEKRPQAVNVRKCTAAETAQEQAWASRNLARFVSVNEIARKGELVCGGA